MSRCTTKMALLCCAAIAFLLAAADGANVLAIESVAAKSHWNFMRGVLRALADRGHRVTVYTPFPDSRDAATVVANSNYTEVNTSEYYNKDTVALNIDITLATQVFCQPSILVPMMANGSRFTCDQTNRVLSDLLPDSGAYDVFITEPLSCECASHAVRRLGDNVPLVYTVPMPLLPWMEATVLGRYVNPAYESHIIAKYIVPDTFYRRLHSVALHLYTTYAFYRYILTEAPDRPYDHAPPIKPSLMFVNTHFITESAKPTPANRINVGGIHLAAPAPLPPDILEFIENSSNGVIYFTFGTVVAMSTLPDHIQRVFIDAFARIPQRVLVKFEGEMKDTPKNVMTRKWLPQRDILLHPKVKLFIAHGGISGVYEAVDAGVPVLGFPLFYDQPRNIEHLVDAGMAISMDLMTITTDKLLSTINEIINNEKYSKNAKIVSERFKDRPMSPAELVVYWTEYVIRHKGAPHLKSHALNLTWYQYFLLDVFSVVLVAFILVCYITYKGLVLIKKIVFKLSSNLKSKVE